MAILGQIRKRSIFLIIVIGMALFAFVISGVFTSNGGFNSNQPIGEINGEDIDFEMFNLMVEQAQSVYGLNTIQAVNFAWNQGIRTQSLIQEIDKLGIDAGRNQLEEIISRDESIILNPLFQNEIGLFDFNKFSNYISQLKTSNPTMYNSWKLQEENIIALARQQIYFDLIKSSIYLTNSESTSQFHFENDKVDIEYLRIPFEAIPDSVIKIRESEISSFLKNNRDKYEIEESKKMEYVFIPDVASELDENNIKINLEQLKSGFNQLNQITNSTEYVEGFESVENYSDFIDVHSEVSWDSIYKTKQELSGSFSDILFGLNIGQVFGPYKDGNFYKISRMIDKKKEDNLNKVLIADVIKEIIPSNESSNDNYRIASQVEFDANNDLDLNASNEGLRVNTFESFAEFDEGIPGINNSRQVIKWVYEKNSRTGDVKRFTLSDGYLVAKINESNKKRLPLLDDVRDEISQILILDKKYEYLNNKYKNNANIKGISDDYDLNIENASAVTQNDPILVGAGIEPYIIGSAFSLEPNEISKLLKGNNGIYIIKLISKVIEEDSTIDQLSSNLIYDREVERLSNLIPEILESKAEIIDNRSFYY